MESNLPSLHRNKATDVDVLQRKVRYALSVDKIQAIVQKTCRDCGGIDAITGLPFHVEDQQFDNWQPTQQFWDDISGKKTKPELKKAGNVREFQKHMVYTKVPVSFAWKRTSKKPIGVRWVDINKGDDVHPNYSSRLVAKEIKVRSDLSLFAATPPWETIKLLFSLAVTRGVGWDSTEALGKKIDVIDVRRAVVYCP